MAEERVVEIFFTTADPSRAHHDPVREARRRAKRLGVEPEAEMVRPHVIRLRSVTADERTLARIASLSA